MLTICFYQDTRHEKPLFWIKKKLGIGYISHRKDGITEFRINGFEQLESIMKGLYPYVKFKKKQVSCVLKILQIIGSKESLFALKKQDKKRIAKAVLQARQENYQSGSKGIEKLKLDLEMLIEMVAKLFRSEILDFRARRGRRAKCFEAVAQLRRKAFCEV